MTLASHWLHGGGYNFVMALATVPPQLRLEEIFAALHLDLSAFEGTDLDVRTPIDGSVIARLRLDTPQELYAKIARSARAFEAWRDVPAPKRGELVRLLGEELRAHKALLGHLVSVESGKILEEGLGEVQEMIDICDFAVGLSRQLYGLTIASERPNHTMSETYRPLGPVGIISAFNFPVAVWSWNAALAWVCGDSTLWKPSEKTPLTALACQAIFDHAAAKFGHAPEGLSQVVLGRGDLGAAMAADRRLPLISATGSTRMGAAVGPVVAARFGRSLLELGGNNAVIVAPSADLDVAIPSLLFGSVGTCGQRCTSTRRILVHESLADSLFERLAGAYASLDSKIGDPLDAGTLIGPLIDQAAYEAMQQALADAKSDADKIVGGERMFAERAPDAFYVRPALAKMKRQGPAVLRETFAPIAYVMSYRTLDEAIELHNEVAHGLSSAIMTTDVREAELFKLRSDCGIANVNIGTSGAEIGGAFGGEKETGGGRESGSDAWKQYMRRQTSTTFYGFEKPALAQGIVFDADAPPIA